MKDMFSAHGLIGLVLAGLAVGYGLVKWDLIPDAIMGFGYLDDVVMAVIAFLVGSMIGRKVLGVKSK